MSHSTLPQMVHITRLTVHPANKRDDMGDLNELADAIRAQGLLNPLTVCKRPDMLGYYWVMAGARRLAACKMARLDMVPVMIQRASVIGDARALEIKLVENLHRKGQSPMETARDMGRLRDDCFYTVGRIAKTTGLSPSAVSYHLELLDADEATQQRILAGVVTAGAVHAAVRQNRAKNRYGPAKSKRKVSVSPPHFGKTHPLADEVREACTHLDRRLPGLVGCGACWEQAIRRDALAAAPLVFRAPAEVA